MNSMLLPSLSVEIAYVALAGALLLIHIIAQSSLLTRQFGSQYNAGARDEQRQVSGVAGRAERALRNYLETFPLFAALALAIVLADKANWWSGFGAALYFWARVAYLPLYLTGVPYLRSVAWAVAITGLVIILWQLAF